MSQRIYYRITGGVVAAAHARFHAKFTALQSVRDAVIKEFGASGTYGNRHGVKGLLFTDGKTPPADWKRVPGEDNVFQPNPRTKTGRNLRDRLKTMKQVTAEDFQAEVLGSSDFTRFATFEGSSFRCAYIGFEILDNVLILSVPAHEANPFVPPDEHCVEIKMSEYWALKAADAKAEEVKP